MDYCTEVEFINHQRLREKCEKIGSVVGYEAYHITEEGPVIFGCICWKSYTPGEAEKKLEEIKKEFSQENLEFIETPRNPLVEVEEMVTKKPEKDWEKMFKDHGVCIYVKDIYGEGDLSAIYKYKN